MTVESNAQTLFKEVVVQEVAHLVRTRGFRGSAGRWTSTSATGDSAIVNLQKSKWNTADEVGFAVNLSVVPKPWFEWHLTQFGLPASSKPHEYNGLWRQRLRPSRGLPADSDFWLVSDSASARACGKDAVDQLDQVWIPRLLELLNRDSLIRAIRAGDFGYMTMSPLMPLAIMLSDSGPGVELEQAITRLESELPGWGDWKSKDQFVTWVRDRAEQQRHH